MQVEPNNYLIQLFQSGHGCNLTLYNPNVRKEEDQDDEDLGGIGQHLASSGFNNSGTSFDANAQTNKGSKQSK